MKDTISGRIFVVGDNIDTDQIIPAQYLNLVPTIPEEYAKLGTHALSGLPEDYPPLVKEDASQSEYTVIVAGRNFGCGSSREHAPVSLGAAGVKAVVAESFARIFFRNCISTGEVYPVETSERLCEKMSTGDAVEIDLSANTLKHLPSGAEFALAPLGDAKDVVDGGGLFEYARQTGMIASR